MLLRMKKQPFKSPRSLLDRNVKSFAYFEICSSSPIFLGVAYFFGGFPQKTFCRIGLTRRKGCVASRRQELAKTHPDIPGKFA